MNSICLNLSEGMGVKIKLDKGWEDQLFHSCLILLFALLKRVRWLGYTSKFVGSLGERMYNGTSLKVTYCIWRQTFVNCSFSVLMLCFILLLQLIKYWNTDVLICVCSSEHSEAAGLRWRSQPYRGDDPHPSVPALLRRHHRAGRRAGQLLPRRGQLLGSGC